MVSYLQKVETSLQKLKSIEESPATLQDRVKLLTSIKIDLTNFQNIPPCLEIDAKECILARETYEHAVFLSIEQKDIQSFERNFSVLRTYYDEFDGVLPVSERKYPVLGLYLLYLLSFNKISEYHTEIELIPIADHTNLYIKVPVSLEQYFVEGAYNKILNSKHNLPMVAY
jgi:26S proteasome regulatory subunit N12